MRKSLRSRALAPRDWQTKPLGSVVDRVTDRNVEHNQNVLTISAQEGLISQKEYFSRRVASENVDGYYLLRRGDFAYNKSYSAGFPVGVIRRLERYAEGIVSPLYICFRPTASDVDSDFLKHYFAAGLLDDDIGWIAKEGVRNHGLLNVGVADFLSVDVSLPPATEQRRIAEILDTLDEAICKTEQIIAKLKHVKKGLLHDLLTRGIDDNGELRDPARHPEQFKQSELGRTPIDWRLVSLAEVVPRAVYGISVSLDDNDGIPVLRMNNLRDGEAELSELKYSASSKAQELLLRPGDVLFNRTNSIDHVGRTGIWRGQLEKASFASYLVRLEVDPATLNNEFLCRWLNWESTQIRIRRYATPGVQQVNINPTNLRRTVMSLPASLREQEEIVSKLASVDLHFKTEKLGRDKLVSLKQGLSEDLLTGRVRVTTLPDEAAA